MSLDKSQDYIYRLGSDTQHRLHWTGSAWQYELLASAVLFDEQMFHSDKELTDGLALVGLTIDKFSVDTAKYGESYSTDIKKQQQELIAQGMDPCPKHGMTAKIEDGTCEACNLTDYPDDFKGQEG